MVLDSISDNMTELVKTDKCGAINTTDKSNMGYYVVKFLSETFMLQEKCKHNFQIIEAGESVLNAQYMDCMKFNKNWC